MSALLTIPFRLELRRGLRADLPSTSDLIGEPFFCEDTGELFVWNGTSMVEIGDAEHAYIDAQDAATLASAKSYTDVETARAESVESALAVAVATKTSATYVDTQDAATLAAAEAYTDAHVPTGVELVAHKDQPNGYPSLDVTGHIPLSELPASIQGALEYQGVWDASANSPSLASSVGTKGFFYKVSVAGNTSLDGNTNWHVGDLLIFDGTTWDKVDNYEAVTSVAGRTGAVTLAESDVANLTTDLASLSSAISGKASIGYVDAETTRAQAAEATLTTAVAGKQASLGFTPENAANKNAANGYGGLDAAGLVLGSLDKNPLFDGMTGAKFICSVVPLVMPQTTATFYTVPSNKRALFLAARAVNDVLTGSTALITFYPVGFSGGSDLFLTGALAMAAQGGIATHVPAVPFLLEAGEKLNLHFSATGGGAGVVQIQMLLIEFDATSFIKGPKVYASFAGTLVKGDQTLYTCPSGKRAMSWTPGNLGAILQNLQNFGVVNGSGSTWRPVVSMLKSGYNRRLANITNLQIASTNVLSVTVDAIGNFAVGDTVAFNQITNATWTFLNGTTSGQITAIDPIGKIITCGYTHATIASTAISAGQVFEGDNLISTATKASGAPATFTGLQIPVFLEAGDSIVVNSDLSNANADLMLSTCLYECPAA